MTKGLLDKFIFPSIVFFVISVSVVSQNSDDNLLLHYSFSGNFEDSTGNGFHGQAEGSTLTTDRNGNANEAAYFDGIDDYIIFPNDNALKPNLPVSFSFWVKYDSDDFEDRALFNTSFEDDRSSGVYFNTEISTGRYAINFGNGTENYVSTTRQTYTSNTLIETENWHHIFVVVESSIKMRIYVDCNENGGTFSGSGGFISYSMTPGNLGRRDRNLNTPPLYFEGALDDFMYWDRAFTDDELIKDGLCEFILGVDDINSTNNSLQIYPNPAKDILRLKSKSALIKTIEIYNVLGQKVYQSNYKENIDISNLSSGLYIIKAIGNNSIALEKLIIQ